MNETLELILMFIGGFLLVCLAIILSFVIVALVFYILPIFIIQIICIVLLALWFCRGIIHD